MLNISKINKVILIAGLAAAFSLVAGGQAFAADKALEEQLTRAESAQASALQTLGEKNQALAQCQATGGACTAERKAAEAAKKAYDTAAQSYTKAQNAIKKVNDAQKNVDEEWTKARDERDSAQKNYNAKQEAYNKCLAGGGDCSAQRQAAEEAKKSYNEKLTAYNKAQKEASKLANAATKAENQAILAEQRAKEKDLTNAQKEQKTAQKAVNKAQKALDKCKKEAGADCSEQEEALKNANTNLTAAQNKVESAQRALDGTSSSGSGGSGSAGSAEEFLKDNLNLSAADKAALDGGFDNLDRARQEDIIEQLKRYQTSKEKELAAAQANCTRYSGMRSQDAQAKAREACARTQELEQEVNNIKSMASQLNVKPLVLSEGVKAGARIEKYSTGVQDKKNFQGVASFDAAKSVMGTGLIAPGMSEKNYEAGKDVLTSVTRRAARAILELKQIVYVFAGFGLIGFAWAAIFNKISWKWFGNIAMGLFLVANMGRLIEYFAKGGADEYYAAAWNDGAVAGNNGKYGIGDVFNDAFVVYGDDPIKKWAPGIRLFKLDLDSKGNVSENPEEFSASAAGFCKGTSGSGWANFTSCIDDIVSTAKKVSNTVATVKTTVEDINYRIDTIEKKAQIIADAAKDMKGASVGEIINNTRRILNQSSDIISTTTGAASTIGGAVGNIANNVQDMGKSVAQQEELENRRILGEATNSVNAALKGQEWDSSLKGVEKVDGEYAGKKTTATKIGDALSKINNGSQQLNRSAQSGLAAAGTVDNIVNNTSLKDLTFGLSKNDTTLADKRREKEQKKAAEAAAQAASTSGSSSGGGSSGSGGTGNGTGSNSGTPNNNGNTGDGVNKDNTDVSEANPGDSKSDAPSTLNTPNTPNEPNTPNTPNEPKLDDNRVDLGDSDGRGENPNLPTPDKEDKPEISVDPLPNDDTAPADGNGGAPEDSGESNGSEGGEGTPQDPAPEEPAPNDGETPSEPDDDSAPDDSEPAVDGAPETGGVSEADVEEVDIEEGSKEASEDEPDEEDVSEAAIMSLASEAEDLEGEAQKKADAAEEACASNPSSQLCIAAQTAATMAKEIAETKKDELNKLEQKLIKPQAGQIVLPDNKYEGDATPEAKLQASKAVYTESQEKLETAAKTLKTKENLEKALLTEYQQATQKAAETGAEADKRMADRLKKNYDLAIIEKNSAATGLAAAKEDLQKSEANYLSRQKEEREMPIVIQ